MTIRVTQAIAGQASQLRYYTDFCCTSHPAFQLKGLFRAIYLAGSNV
jgi:hypothetical protein